MRTHRYSFLLAASALVLSGTHAQTNTPLAVAEEGPVLAASAGANDNRCAVVFNPEARLYYSIDAGCMRYPVDTYDERGTYLGSVEQGFDYRGAWWDPVAKRLEGNGYAVAGLFVQTLDGTTHRPTGTGVAWHAAAQPQPHSVGTLDTDADQVIYYHEGAVHRYAHATNGARGRLRVKDLPVPLSALNDNSLVYTGMPGYEYGLYDHVQRRLLFINKGTGEYAGYCQLPASAPRRTSFGLSWANGYLWLFDAPNNPGTWRSYRVFVQEPSVAEVPVMQAPATAPIPAEVEAALLAQQALEQAAAEQAAAMMTAVEEAVRAALAQMEEELAQAQVNERREQVTLPEQADVWLYPVPASDLLRIELGGEAPLQGVRVLDLSGRQVLAPLMRTSTSTAQLDVQALPAGAYGLEVLTADGATRHTFVVAR